MADSPATGTDLTLVPTDDLLHEISRRADAYVFAAAGLCANRAASTCVAVIRCKGPLVLRMGLIKGMMLDVDAEWLTLTPSDNDDDDDKDADNESC